MHNISEIFIDQLISICNHLIDPSLDVKIYIAQNYYDISYTVSFERKHSLLLKVNLSPAAVRLCNDEEFRKIVGTYAWKLNKILMTPLDEIPLIIHDEKFEGFNNTFKRVLSGLDAYYIQIPWDEINHDVESSY